MRYAPQKGIFTEEMEFPCHAGIPQIPFPQSTDVTAAPDLGLPFANFSEALASKADENGLILLLVVDSGYLEMALNIYRSSLLLHKIDNFLFICLDAQSSSFLNAEGIGCLPHTNTFTLGTSTFDTMDMKTSYTAKTQYGTDAFRKKTHMKTIVILEALLLGYTVVIVDVDIVFFRNPLQRIQCSRCDIVMQQDGMFKGKSEYNSGFYLVKPTKAGIDLHKKALLLATRNKNLSNQKTISIVLYEMIKKGQIILGTLGDSKYPNGLSYFEKSRHLFPAACPSCVILHNNWIVGNKAKIHRFRSHVLWFVDTDQYYTSTERKYLVYGNPKDFGANTTMFEIQAFKNALFLGHILNRTVILPKFHCTGCKRYVMCRSRWCPLQTHLSVVHLDKYFKNAYREHAFLCHPWVPLSIRRAKPTLKGIVNSHMNLSAPHPGWITYIPNDVTAGPTAQEIVKWFGGTDQTKELVLRLYNLYGTFKELYQDQTYTDFVNKINASIVTSDYRQYQTKVS